MCIARKAGKMKCRMTMQIAARYLNVMPVVDTEYAQVQIFVHVRSDGKKGIKLLLKKYAKMKLKNKTLVYIIVFLIIHILLGTAQLVTSVFQCLVASMVLVRPKKSMACRLKSLKHASVTPSRRTIHWEIPSPNSRVQDVTDVSF